MGTSSKLLYCIAGLMLQITDKSWEIQRLPSAVTMQANPETMRVITYKSITWLPQPPVILAACLHMDTKCLRLTSAPSGFGLGEINCLVIKRLLSLLGQRLSLTLSALRGPRHFIHSAFSLYLDDMSTCLHASSMGIGECLLFLLFLGHSSLIMSLKMDT